MKKNIKKPPNAVTSLKSYLLNRKLLLFSLISLFTLNVYSQKNIEDVVFVETNFENDWSFIEFDPPEGNIWQVGTPSKTILDSAFSTPYALMTDTANMLYAPGKYSFILKLERPAWGNCLEEWDVSFLQKYNFDSLRNSGGYVEVSLDHGLTWKNAIYNYFDMSGSDLTRMYEEDDTLINGEPACILNDTTWNYPYVSSIG